MAVEGTVDVPLVIFGGLVTDMAPADLPEGVSPDCADVKFVSGSVQTRPGLISEFTPIAGNPAVNYLKNYITQTGLLRLLALDAAGSLWKESPQGVLSLISSTIVAGTYGKSASLFTREYLAVSDGKFGLDIPRQFDDTNLDRVSQEGPGAPPSAADENVSQSTTSESMPATVAIVASPNGASENGVLVTITTTGAHGLVANQNVVVAGVGVAGYNGTFPITSVPSTTTFTYIASSQNLANSGGGTAQSTLATYNFASAHGLVVGQLVTTSGITPAGYNVTAQAIFSVPSSTSFTLNLSVAGLGAGGAGTAATAGNIPAGVHKISVAFVTRQGYITVPAPPGQWTAGGGKRVNVGSIPTGPSNVIARILLFTLSGQTSYFYAKNITGIFSSNFIINDNSTTSTTVDFSDVGLAAQINADYLFRLLELGECAGVIDYDSRLFWWGERNKVNTAEGGGGFNNLSFDGGFTPFPNFPLGWTPDPTVANRGGGGIANTQVWGNAYRILGDGASAIRGKITQSAFQDANNVPILQINTAYSVRARVFLDTGSATPTQGVFHINLSSVSGAFTTTGISLNATAITAGFVEYTASILTAQTTMPSDILLQVYVDGTLTTGASIGVDNIELYPTNLPFNTSLVRTSQVELPENYDSVTGFMQVSENDGFAVRSAFILRENLYFVKEHGIYMTQDDGVNEPSGWKVNEVSRKVGTPSVNGVAVGEDWAVIADHTGLYFTTGGEPSKISQEIQPTWDRINWNFGHRIWVQVDVQNRRIYVGVPLDTATTPNTILMMDYRGIEKPDEIATAGPIHTSYSGKLLVLEKSRKWSPWNITTNSGAIVLRFDGSEKLFLGNGVGNGKIYQLTETQLTDDGIAIPGYYTTYFHFSHDVEQAFQLSSHNKLYTYVSLFAEGSGQLLLTPVLPGNSPTNAIASIGLGNPGVRDIEFPINVTAVRSAFKVSTSNAGDWFRLARFIVNAIKHPSAPVRGWN